MRTFVQLSDLHFGTILEPTPAVILEFLADLRPDLVVISGDLSQRAKTDEFLAARHFLDQIAAPRLVVPGNHDVPLYDVARRFLSPLGRYCRYITADLSPSFVDAELAVVGINTARSLTFKGGDIGTAQLDHAAATLDAAPSGAARIVVTHHPFDIPAHLSGVDVVEHAARAMQTFSTRRVDLFLSGHIHLVHMASAELYVPGFHATILQAGSATSTRARGEPNSFFVFRVQATHIECDTRSWDASTGTFELLRTNRLLRISAGAPFASDA